MPLYLDLVNRRCIASACFDHRLLCFPLPQDVGRSPLPTPTPSF
jgi:hypothetical protein